MLIDGNVGSIEVRTGKHFGQSAGRCVVIAHPHPLYQGTMNNKVVTTVEKAAAEVGMASVCFNFRGVGRSEGEYDQGLGEVEDLRAVTQWVQGKGYDDIVWVGFSFGAYIVLSAQPYLKVSQLITIAPPVGLYDFSTLESVANTMPWTMIVAGQDEVVNTQEALDWYRHLEVKPDLWVREQASHFFHGQLIWLREHVKLVLNP